jgi:hypothetical protein
MYGFEFELFGLTPPAMLAALAFRLEDTSWISYGPGLHWLVGGVMSIIFGLVVWAGGTAILWDVVCRRLVAQMQPERGPSLPRP